MSKFRRMKKAEKRRIQRMTTGVFIGVSFVCLVTAGISLSDAKADDLDGQTVRFEAIPIQYDHNQASPGQQDTDGQTVEVKNVHIIEDTQPIPQEYTDVTFVPLPVPMSEEDQKTVFEICQDRDVSFPLVMALIEHESQFDGSARSSTGDSGYMQINDCNAAAMADLGYTDLFDLYQNVSAGVYMLRDLFNKYEGDTTFVLMAYNAGETGAANQRAAGIYETDYTVEILEQAKVFSSYIDNALNE